MLRYLLIFLLMLHGLIHLMGFSKAFELGNFGEIKQHVSKFAGLLWLLCAILLVATAVLFYKQKEWWELAVITVLLSQALIISNWKSAKAGTLINLLILFAALITFGTWRFEKSYEHEVKMALKRTSALPENILRENDIQYLPLPVQRYLRYTQVLDKPRPTHMKVVFEGQMRERGKDWFAFRSEQYNFFDQPERFFFMSGKMYNLEVPGFHKYKNGVASMQIKLLGWYPVVDVEGPEISKGETVTVFNDMCLLAPATLADSNRVKWEPIDSLSARAYFQCEGNRISAVLEFNEKGELVNFRSNDRYEVSQQKYLPFSTPMNHYQNFGGYTLPGYGEAVWQYADREFIYGKFYLKEVTYF